MTSYYKGNNIGLNYDAANATWSFTNEPNDFIDPASFSTAEPAFDYTPPPSQDDDEEDTTCPPGYIYDETLKQCVPDPNYQAPAFSGEPGGDGGYQPDEQNYVDFREMSYDEMVDFGKKKGFFNAAGTFIGAPKSEVPFPFLKGIAQFGLDSQANRFAINFAKKGGKIWNPLESSFIGNLYIPPLTTSGASVWSGTGNITSDFNKKIKDFETATLNTASNYDNYLKESGIGDIRDEQEKERLRKAKYDTEIKAIEARRKADQLRREVEEEAKKKDKERRDFEDLQPGQSVTDSSGDTYTKKDDGGYTFTPSEPVSEKKDSYQTPYKPTKDYTGGTVYGTRGATKEKQQEMKKQDTRPKQRDYRKHHAYGL